jgi:hypothetical protein
VPDQHLVRGRACARWGSVPAGEPCTCRGLYEVANFQHRGSRYPRRVRFHVERTTRNRIHSVDHRQTGIAFGHLPDMPSGDHSAISGRCRSMVRGAPQESRPCDGRVTNWIGWIGAIGSPAALAGLGAAVYELRAGRAERRDEEGNQARLITIEFTKTNNPLFFRFGVHNRSQHPIFDLELVRVGLHRIPHGRCERGTPLRGVVSWQRRQPRLVNGSSNCRANPKGAGSRRRARCLGASRMARSGLAHHRGRPTT